MCEEKAPERIDPNQMVLEGSVTLVDDISLLGLPERIEHRLRSKHGGPNINTIGELLATTQFFLLIRARGIAEKSIAIINERLALLGFPPLAKG